MKYKITFPKEKKEEIIKSLEESKENSIKMNNSKVFKPYKFALGKALGIPAPPFLTTCNYTLLNDTTAIWDYNVYGEGMIKKSMMLAKVNSQLKKDFGDDVKAEIYHEK